MHRTRAPFASSRRGFTFCAILVFSLFVGLLVLPTRQTPADLTEPKAGDAHVAQIVSFLLGREHLSDHQIDDEISRRCLEGFLKSLDPMKVYFYQSDIAEFRKKRDLLDNEIKRGDIKFGYKIYNRFLDRIDEKLKFVDEFLEVDHDFNIQETLIKDPDAARYAANDQESRERWRKRIKYDLLMLKSEDELEGKEARDKIWRRYHSFAKRMRLTNSEELLEMYLTAMTTGFDPHTTYMSPSALENFRISMKLNLDGIGAALRIDDGYEYPRAEGDTSPREAHFATAVTKVIKGGAADKHGMLKIKDQIVSVGQGEEGEMVDVVDMKLGDVVKLIRGKAGTVVRLGVVPDGEKEVKIYKITRAKIELKGSEARGEVIPFSKNADSTVYQLGVIDLPSFYMDMTAARQGKVNFKSTTRDVRKILGDFKSKGVDAVVLDLRHNGGGSLTEAINLTGLFIDQGPVVQVKGSDERVQHYDDLIEGMAWDGPLVVLTSRFSASASEILAGAIQDYHRGLIVGDRSTHGKGTVQSLLDLGAKLFEIPGGDAPNMGALKITMQQFYRPNGESTQKRGVAADVVLPAVTNHMDIGESDLDYAVDFDQVPAAQYSPYNHVQDNLSKKLSQLSITRRQASEDFVKLAKRISGYRRQKERKVISLHEKTFMADRAELKVEEEEADEEKPDNVIFERDYYSDEVLNITIDYLEMLKDPKVAIKR